MCSHKHNNNNDAVLTAWMADLDELMARAIDAGAQASRKRDIRCGLGIA